MKITFLLPLVFRNFTATDQCADAPSFERICNNFQTVTDTCVDIGVDAPIYSPQVYLVSGKESKSWSLPARLSKRDTGVAFKATPACQDQREGICVQIENICT